MWIWVERSWRGALHSFLFVPTLIGMLWLFFFNDVVKALIWTPLKPISDFIDSLIPFWLFFLLIIMPLWGLTGALAYEISKKVAYKIASFFS